MNSQKGQESYTNLMMTCAMLDCNMHCYQAKIEFKTYENTKLQKQVNTYKNKVESLKKSIQATEERVEEMKNNIEFHRNSRPVTEGLIMSMQQELQKKRENRIERQKARDSIIKKYSEKFQAYHNVYKSLPWAQEKHELKISIEIGRINLEILKNEYSSYKKKLILFNKIGEQRVQIAIINFSQLMVEKYHLQKEIESISLLTIEAERKLEELIGKKKETIEKINYMVQAAVAEARQRARIVQTSSSMGVSSKTMPSLISSNTTTIGSESIFSRLGIKAPASLKRPLPFNTNISTKMARILEMPTKLTTHLPQVNEEFQAVKKTKESVRSPEKAQEIKEVECTKLTISPQIVTNNNGAENQQETSEPVLKQFAPENQKKTKNNFPSSDDSIQLETEKKKKKLKKKVKKNPNEKEKIEKRVTFAMEKDNEESMSSISNKQNETTEDNVVQMENTGKSETPHLESVSRTDVEHARESETPTGNISVDNNYLPPSPTFNTENRISEIVSRTIESPEFFFQRPQGYCFSPPFIMQQTRGPIMDKSDKGDSQACSYDFASPTMSPVFHAENQNTHGASSSPFSSFFQQTSPKKSDKSNKQFFQLFG